MTNLAISK